VTYFHNYGDIYTTQKKKVLIQPGNKYFLKNKEHEYACETFIVYPAKQYLLSEGYTGMREPYKKIYNCMHLFYMVI